MIPDGFAIGHWTDTALMTGCTVILCPPRTVGGCDVRGSSPGTRETALLESEKKMEEVHAVLLTGGSAFGLAAADGVMRFLEEKARGYRTPWGIVPIVPGAVVFDLNRGSPAGRPGPEDGYSAARAAAHEGYAEGLVGAGTGTTVGKWGGMASAMSGGFAVEHCRSGELLVSAAAVVNALGDIIDARGEILAGARDASGAWKAGDDPLARLGALPAPGGTSTVLVAVMTNGRFSKVDANRIASRAHDGMARAVRPAHTSYDGDTVFCLAGGDVAGDVDSAAEMAAESTARAIRRAVTIGRER
ncbi:MAG TPA: P1 family peptidase [Bacteroidota bacterium]|nr:P1 family peptidase [Bacteroidota bacterium]